MAQELGRDALVFQSVDTKNEKIYMTLLTEEK